MSQATECGTDGLHGIRSVEWHGMHAIARACQAPFLPFAATPAPSADKKQVVAASEPAIRRRGIWALEDGRNTGIIEEGEDVDEDQAHCGGNGRGKLVVQIP
jgi:hypothetical protein